MAVSRVDEQHLRTNEPGRFPGDCATYFERIIEYSGIGCDADESRDRHARKTDGSGSVQEIFPPVSCRLLRAGLEIMGVINRLMSGMITEPVFELTHLPPSHRQAD